MTSVEALPVSSDNSSTTPIYYYRLRVNINSFNQNDVKINLIKENLINKVKINATNTEIDEKLGLKSTKEYSKVFELPTKTCLNINLETMETYFDTDNHLVIQFKSNKAENHLISLLNNSKDDDVYVDIIERTAKNLLNYKNLDDIKETIENALSLSNFNFKHEAPAQQPPVAKTNDEIMQKLALNDDVHLLSKHNNLPAIHFVDNGDGKKLVRVNVKIPQSINKVISLDQENGESADKTTTTYNHLYLKCNNLTVSLDAEAKINETTSKFTKQFNLPNGTVHEKLNYYLDTVNHSLVIEAPFQEEEES